MRVLVSGMVAGEPGQGGAAWAVLQYLLGLRRLGHEVILVEPVDDARAGRASPTWSAVARELRPRRKRRCSPPTARARRSPRQRAGRLAREADLLLNVSGMLADEELLEPIPAARLPRPRPLLQPALARPQGADMRLRPPHPLRHRRTGDRRAGAARCRRCGCEWITTLPPVVLEHWPLGDRGPHAAPSPPSATGAATARSSTTGCRYGLRAHALRELIEPAGTRPARGSRSRSASIPATARTSPRWRRTAGSLLDPAAVAATPDAYASSSAPRGRSSGREGGLRRVALGWFSDRSACYLASGRPVVAAGHRLRAALPTGEGLLAFDDVDGAAAAIERSARDSRARRRGAGDRRGPARLRPRARRGCSRRWGPRGERRAARERRRGGARGARAGADRGPGQRPPRSPSSRAGPSPTRPASRSTCSTSGSPSGERLALLVKDVGEARALGRGRRDQARRHPRPWSRDRRLPRPPLPCRAVDAALPRRRPRSRGRPLVALPRAGRGRGADRRR